MEVCGFFCLALSVQIATDDKTNKLEMKKTRKLSPRIIIHGFLPLPHHLFFFFFTLRRNLTGHGTIRLVVADVAARF